MASLVRTRSQSASPSSTPLFSSNETWRVATKRAHPHPTTNACSPQKGDVDAGRRGKKRRRQELKDIPPSVFDACDAATTATHTTYFPSTSFEFGLRPERGRESKPKTRRLSLAEQRPERYEEQDLASLRANAFWELRRSVAENGEGLVRRMRDYEHSRSKSDIYSRAKEAQKLELKRRSLAGSTRRTSLSDQTSDEEGQDEDEVQIIAGDEPPINRMYCRTRSVSLDAGRQYVYTDKRGDQAIAELGLALANGAGGMTDYRPVLAIQTVSEEFQVGEMWN